MGEEPTEFAGFANAETEHVHAWALDPEPVEARWTRGRVAAFVAVGLAVVGAVGISVAVTLTAVEDHPSAPSSSSMVPATLSKAPDDLAAYDRKFFAAMQNLGWLVEDPEKMAGTAHHVCDMYRSGSTPEDVYDWLSGDMQLSLHGAMQFASTVRLTYPNC